VLNGESRGAWGLKMGDESHYAVVAAVSGSFWGSVGCEFPWGFTVFRQFVYDLDRTCLVTCYLMTSQLVRQVLASITAEQKSFPCTFSSIFPWNHLKSHF
jgi:hypothetical protein